jgi:tRNA wybutosine-synthesizing protein 4
MANVYCQISGSKRLILFPPADIGHLAFEPGASSSSVEVFSLLNSPVTSLIHPHEAKLYPGDVLFIPPLWLHAAAPISDISIAVNIFFRDLESGYSTGRDIYGNRDLAAYEKGRQGIARVEAGFQKLPLHVREFYIQRLASELLRGIQDR